MLSLSKTDHRRSHASVIVIAVAFLFLFPATVFAISLREYQHKIEQAITALDTLAQVDEHETESDFNKRLVQTVEAVRVALPEHLTVEANGETYEVDNSALHKTLEDIKSVSVEEQLKKIDDMKATLRALEARIVERVSAQPGVETKDQAKGRLESILARPEYATG